MKILKPALYDGPNGWSWVLLGDLANVIGQTPRNTWINFFRLTSRLQVLEVVPAQSMDLTYTVYARSLTDRKFVSRNQSAALSDLFEVEAVNSATVQGIFDAIALGEIFVPAGWAMEVLKAHELGVAHVKMVCHQHQVWPAHYSSRVTCLLSDEPLVRCSQIEVGLAPCMTLGSDGTVAAVPVGYDDHGELVIVKKTSN